MVTQLLGRVMARQGVERPPLSVSLHSIAATRLSQEPSKFPTLP